MGSVLSSSFTVAYRIVQAADLRGSTSFDESLHQIHVSTCTEM